MRKAKALCYYDVSDNEGLRDVCKALTGSRNNDTKQNHFLLVKYAYNRIREIFGIENVIQLTHKEDLSEIMLTVYDCKPSEITGPAEVVEEGNERYIVIID